VKDVCQAEETLGLNPHLTSHPECFKKSIIIRLSDDRGRWSDRHEKPPIGLAALQCAVPLMNLGLETMVHLDYHEVRQ
jgi:hypothetical protein